VNAKVCWIINRLPPQQPSNVVALPTSVFHALIKLIVVITSLQCTWLMAATVVISNERSGDLVFMDEKGDTLDVVPLCGRPKDIEQHEAVGSLFIACSDDNKVIEFDIASKTTRREFSDLPGATSLAFHAASNRLLVSNEGTANATVLDVETGKVIANLPTGHEPDGILINEDGTLIFVASENSGLVHVFNGTTYQAIDRIITNLRPRRMALRAQELWVSSEMGSRVEIFDVATFRKMDEIIFAPRGFRSEQLTPVDILFNQAQTTGFVALGSANNIAIINAESREIVKYILVGHRPWGLGLTPDEKRLFVLNGLSDDVTIIDLEKNRPVKSSRTGLVPNSVEIIR